MGAKIFVGNLSAIVSENHLNKIFGHCGQVHSVKVATDFKTGCSKGFAFVTMGSSAEAQKAISRFDKVMIDGKSIVVTDANAIGSASSPLQNRSGAIRTYRRAAAEDQIFRQSY